jgi:dihydrofolate reductase
MRRLRYRVASSLDGFIAGPNAEADWIIPDPEIDFAAIFKQFDTALIGRRTFDTMVAAGQTKLPGMRMFVFSRSLRQKDFPKVELASEDVAGVVSALKAASGKDIWLFGGGSLFRSLLDAKLVDTVEVAIIPVILGDGLPHCLSLRRTRSINRELSHSNMTWIEINDSGRITFGTRTNEIGSHAGTSGLPTLFG